MDFYAIYLRKSRKDIEAEARGEGETLARHHRTLNELANKLVLPIGEVYREVVSGETLAARPEAQRLLEDVESGKWQGVLVMEVERLARGETIDQGIVAQAFKYSGTKIITPTKIYDPANEFDEEYFEFSLFMSRREYQTIRRRMQGGRIAAAKEGKYLGSKAPYGYARAAIAGGWSLEPLSDEAAVVRDIYEWYVTGALQADGSFKRLGVSLICRRLNDMRVPTRNGGAWVTATVRGILTNPVYIGKIRWDHRKTKKAIDGGQRTTSRPRAPVDSQIISNGLHPALISDDLWQRAQTNMADNRPVPVQRSNSVKNPLAGLIVCGKCGRRMVRRPYANGQPPALICSCNACDNVSSELSIVEQKLISVLAVWLEQYEVSIQNGTADQQSTEAECAALARITDELAETDKQRENLYRLVERGVYSDELFFERRNALDASVANLKQEAARLRSEIDTKEAHNEVAGVLIPKMRRVIDTYNTADSAQVRNDMLKEILAKIVYTRESGGRWEKDKFNFVLALYPKWPKDFPRRDS